MKLVKIFIGLLVVIMILYFLLQNTRLVTVDLIFIEFPNAPVSVVMLGSLGVGILFGYAAAVAIIISGSPVNISDAYTYICACVAAYLEIISIQQRDSKRFGAMHMWA